MTPPTTFRVRRHWWHHHASQRCAFGRTLIRVSLVLDINSLFRPHALSVCVLQGQRHSNSVIIYNVSLSQAGLGGRGENGQKEVGGLKKGSYKPWRENWASITPFSGAAISQNSKYNIMYALFKFSFVQSLVLLLLLMINCGLCWFARLSICRYLQQISWKIIDTIVLFVERGYDLNCWSICLLEHCSF